MSVRRNECCALWAVETQRDTALTRQIRVSYSWFRSFREEHLKYWGILLDIIAIIITTARRSAKKQIGQSFENDKIISCQLASVANLRRRNIRCVSHWLCF
jgi:hypothetical protein